MAVDAVLKIIDKEKDTNVDLRDINVSKKLGETIDERLCCYFIKTYNSY